MRVNPTTSERTTWNGAEHLVRWPVEKALPVVGVLSGLVLTVAPRDTQTLKRFHVFRFASALIIAATALGCQTTNNSSSPPADTSSETAPSTEYATRSSKGEVSLALTPRMTDEGLVVALHPETHSGDLAEIDLATAVKLEADGKTYTPVATKPMSGHHGDGSVTFDVKTPPERFAVTINDVRGSGP